MATSCYDVYRVQAIPSIQGPQVTSGLLLPVVSDSTITLSIGGLAANTVYNTTITTVNINGEAMSAGLLQFSKCIRLFSISLSPTIGS